MNASIFRTPSRRMTLEKSEKIRRWKILEQKTKQLIDQYPLNTEEEKEAKRTLDRNKELAWAILQHYKKCDTPYLDLTHSLRVAASFATNNSKSGYIYVIGMPYPYGTISHFIDQDMVLIHLQSACHHTAKRPHFQEGWLAGSYYLNKDCLKSNQNFSRRLIAKFHIDDTESFWSNEFPRIPKKSLLPEDDKKFSWV